MTSTDPTKSLEERFRAGFVEGAADECWEWLGARLDDPPHHYGLLRNHYRRVYAHRVALALKLGRHLRRGEQALHSCDNPPCVNPAHLRSGSQRRNVQDAVDRDRMRKAACRRGHRRTAENTRLYVDHRGYTQQFCRDCERMRVR